MNIWHFRKTLLNRLLTWNIVNIAGGLALQAQKRPAVRGIGVQAIAWGAINIGIALGGRLLASRREAHPNAHSLRVLAEETRNLRRILWLNTWLDVLYMLGGALFARRSTSDFRRGNGFGVMIQGALLLCFDLIHVLRLK